MPYKPSDARRRELGAELRRRRELAGLNGLDLAKRTGWSQSTVSRIESGQGPVSEVSVTTYLAHCGVPAPDVAEVLALARETEDGYLVRRKVLRTLILHETTARSIRSVAPLIVPGLLQTEGYARAMMGLADNVDETTVDSRVAVRTERQSLLKKWNPPAFTYFIYEAALRCPVGTNRVMNEQMLHLAFLADRPQVTLRVVPFEDGAVAAAIGQFTLMDFADHGPVLYSENIFASLFVENPEDIQFAKKYLAELDGVALSAEKSREFLVRCAGDYDRPDQGVLNVRRANPGLVEE